MKEQSCKSANCAIRFACVSVVAHCSGTGVLLDLDLSLLGWGNIVYIVNRNLADLLIAEASGRGYAGYAMLCYAMLSICG